jgi:hypothetical protein
MATLVIQIPDNDAEDLKRFVESDAYHKARAWVSLDFPVVGQAGTTLATGVQGTLEYVD